MRNRLSDRAFYAVVVLVAIVVVALIGLTFVRLTGEIQDLRNKNDNQQQQIDKNKDNIQDQQQPCQPEDVRYPERASGCTDQSGKSNNSEPTIPVASGSVTRFGGGGSAGTFNPQPANQIKMSQPEAPPNTSTQNPTPTTPPSNPDPPQQSLIGGDPILLCVDGVLNTCL